MTNQRYVTPAVVAAALHAVLLFGFPSSGPKVEMTKPEVNRTILRPFPPELVPPPVRSDDEVVRAEQVKPLRGEPPPPDISEAPSPRPSNFTLATDEFKPTFASLTNTRLPPMVGVVGGDPHGRPISGDMTDVTDFTKLDKVPRAKVQVAPNYPFELKRNGVEGSVLIEFQVDATGQVVTARVVRSDRREFEEPTLRAVMKWRFEPGRYNGRAVPFRMQIPVDFHLNQE